MPGLNLETKWIIFFLEIYVTGRKILTAMKTKQKSQKSNKTKHENGNGNEIANKK